MLPHPTATAAGPPDLPPGTLLQHPDMSDVGPMEQSGEIASMIREFLGGLTAWTTRAEAGVALHRRVNVPISARSRAG